MENKYKGLEKFRDIITKSYSDETRSALSLSEEYGVSYATMLRALARWGIKIRGRVSKNKFLRDKAWLRKRYIDDGRSIRQISEELGLPHGTVGSSLYWAKIPVRSISEGIKSAGPRTGDKASHWKGGIKTTSRGYIYKRATGHPFATQDGYVMEHRLVMESKIGRFLTPSEVVNHFNGVKGDNRIDNLELVSDRGTHTRNHFKDSFETKRLRKLLLDNGINPDAKA